MALTTRETLVRDIAQILGDTFGSLGAAQSYNYDVAEQIVTASEDENYTPIMIDNIVYGAYMDAVAATQITDLVDEMLNEG